MANSNKAILIFSTKYDLSTLEVIKWLNFYSIKFYLIEQISDLNKYNIRFNEEFISKNISAIWYRKLYIEMPIIQLEEIEVKQSVSSFLQKELEYFYYSIEKQCANVKSLGSGFSKMDVNKIEVLIKAKKHKLTIPNYVILCNKGELVLFNQKYQKIITKPIFNAAPIKLEEFKIGFMYTKIIESELIANLPDVFPPSLFQEYIEKIYELRVFYIDGAIYATAIFSKNNNEHIDYRDKENSTNRHVSYKLPQDVKQKLKSLMTELKLNTGSIDMIKSTNGEYVFLEVNPCGIYESMAINCNYNLNKLTAKWLMKSTGKKKPNQN